MKRDQALRLTEIDFALLIVIGRLKGFVFCYFSVNMVAPPCKIDVQLTYYNLSISTDDVIIFMTGAFLFYGGATQEAVPPQWSIDPLGLARENLLWFRNFAAAEPNDETTASFFAKTSAL